MSVVSGYICQLSVKILVSCQLTVTPSRPSLSLMPFTVVKQCLYKFIKKINSACVCFKVLLRRYVSQYY